MRKKHPVSFRLSDKTIERLEFLAEHSEFQNKTLILDILIASAYKRLKTGMGEGIEVNNMIDLVEVSIFRPKIKQTVNE
jgi:hypothetical protein